MITIEWANSLRNKYDWPDNKPLVKPDNHGWFRSHNAAVLKMFLSEKTGSILELGAWLGKSTRHLCQFAPNAAVVTIDHWKGSEEHYLPERTDVKNKLPHLYETFLVNCWEYKERLLPVKNNTIDGMNELFNEGFVPEVIYIDASHDYRNAYNDLSTAHKLWPNALIIGDDWEWPGVHQAVVNYSYSREVILSVYGNCWWLKW